MPLNPPATGLHVLVLLVVIAWAIAPFLTPLVLTGMLAGVVFRREGLL
jgi:hypothetical protein